MTLAEFLAADPRQTDEEFAGKIGVSRSMVTRMRNGHARPSAAVALRIENATGRKVTLSDLLLGPEKIEDETGEPEKAA